MRIDILSMFGTTETQRAVSFFQIPSWHQDPSFLDKMTEVIPAGRGMHDVQLLVVNREDREKQCDIGEIGEIYVRAGGLAEGYLGEELAELTRTKFVENWFVEPRKWIEQDRKRVSQQKIQQPWRQYYKGPRDRLYRSGDLGRYMPSGDVVSLQIQSIQMIKLTPSRSVPEGLIIRSKYEILVTPHGIG